ncbi:hypothetical protein HDF26_004895 [Pedobacter cryoconitis]|uniref:Putative auto-transporter adhesin head GIN domain-containing protein n=1 Tax=Pedobacter cryoconitis TaxID=188932 RepID=A0A7W9E0P4_9SPHI|nr:head GIN domain-containing protein [Pedobacter cryoconitis]MBB5638677.1 hypothetical protein [Pedobacter cryoconitis]MBB6274421.1 hypothetical protein [Pedobacter cryoconitis]
MKSNFLLKPTLLLLITATFSTLTLKAQETKNITLNNVSGVSVHAGIDLFITQGNSESAKIIANSDVINEVVVENSAGNVNVTWKNNQGTNNWKNKSAKVYITYKKLNSIAASSGSSLKTENTLKTDALDVKVSSGANLTASIACKDVQVKTSSGANATLSGTATNLDVKSSSGANLKAFDLTTDYANATASSGADIKINVAKGLETTSSSGGSIRYKGGASLKNNSSRSGSVNKAD